MILDPQTSPSPVPGTPLERHGESAVTGNTADSLQTGPCLLYSANGAAADADMRLRIRGQDLPCRIRRRRGGLSLRLDGGRVLIGCPRSASRKELSVFVQESESWLLRQIDASVDIDPPRDSAGRPQLLLDGKLVSVALMPEAQRQAVSACDIRRVDDATNSIGAGLIAIPGNIDPAAWFRDWLKARASRSIDKTLPGYAALLVADYRKVRVRDYSAQWGSCIRVKSGGYNLSFNSRLAMMPDWVRQYVILHELCHCRIYDHSARFWQLLDRHCARLIYCSSADAKEWLNRNDALLRVNFGSFFSRISSANPQCLPTTRANSGPESGVS